MLSRGSSRCFESGNSSNKKGFKVAKCKSTINPQSTVDYVSHEELKRKKRSPKMPKSKNPKKSKKSKGNKAKKTSKSIGKIYDKAE